MSKKESVILSAELLISEVLKQNIDLHISKKVDLKTELLKFENFQITFPGKREGFILRFFWNTIKAPLLMFFPDEFISKYVKLKNDKGPEPELLSFMGLIPKFLLQSETIILNSFDKKLDLLSHFSSRFKDKDEFLWNISSYEIIQIKIDSIFCFMFIEHKVLLTFNKYCQEHLISLESIKNYPKGNFSVLRVSDKQNESQAGLLLGRFFLPRFVFLGEYPAVSGFDAIIFEPESVKKRDGLNIVLNLSISGILYNVNYFIPSKTESRGNITGIIQALIRSVLPLWRKYFEIEKVGGSNKLPDSFRADCILNGGVKYKNSLIPVEIGISKDVLSLLTKKLIKNDNNFFSNFTRVLLIEQFLISVFLTENLFLPLSLSEYLNLIDEIDRRKIIQNFFSGTGWKGDEIQKLFSYSKKDYQKKKIYYFADPFFDRKSFFKYLPKSQKDEWQKDFLVSDSYNEMNDYGRKALLDIYHSWRSDHLDLSFRASTLLKNEFKVQGDKKIREEIDHIMVSEPFENILEDTFPRDVQNLLAKLTAKVLANALVLYTDSFRSLEPFMSRNYKAEVKDLIKIIQRKSISNGFEMEKIKEDFFILHNGLKELPKEEFI